MLALYPDQMNIYGDRGNIVFLRRRCEWRGINFSYAGAGAGEAVDPAAHDLFYIGGGQDRDQRAVAADMVQTKREALPRRPTTARSCLVSAADTSWSARYQLGEEELPGAGIADLETVREPGSRLIGNLTAEWGERQTIVGFENHGGRTYLGPDASRGRVLSGFGNDGTRLRGRARPTFGCYLHGPVLPKNPAGRRADRTGLDAATASDPTSPLDDAFESRAHESARRI